MRQGFAIAALLLLPGVLSAAEPAPDTAAVEYAKIHLQGDRILEGIVVREDEATITLKTRLGTVPVRKDQIVRVVRSEATVQGLADRERARHVYRSLLLGYRLVKPAAWSFKLDPPEPLSDVLVRRYDEDLEVSVSGQPDPDPRAPMTEQTLAMMTQAAETRLREKFLDVKREASRQTTFKDRPALFLEFSLRRKRTLRDYRMAQTVVRHAGKILFLGVWAPKARFEEARAAYDGILASLEFVEPAALEGDRLFDPTHLFSVEKPAAWTFVEQPAKDAVVTTAVLAAPGGAAAVRIDASRPGRAPDAEAWARASEEAQLKALAGARKVSAGPVNIGGRFGVRLLIEGALQGKPVRRAVHFLKDEDRGFVITADVAVEQAATLQPVVDEVLGGFRILNDLLAEGALERGLKAIEQCDAGDRELDAKRPREAIPCYDRAIAAFPRFAGAWNNKGLACLDADDLDGARQALQRAQQLFGEDLTIRLNLASCRLREAMRKVKEGNPAEAIRLVDEAKALSGSHADARSSIAALYANVGVYYAEKDNFEQASVLFKRALQVTPDDPQLKKSLAVLLGNAAVTYGNKGQEAKALRLAKEALLYDPANAGARQVIDALNRR